MAVERPAPVVLGRLIDVFPDLSHDRRAKRDIRYEVAVPTYASKTPHGQLSQPILHIAPFDSVL